MIVPPERSRFVNPHFDLGVELASALKDEPDVLAVLVTGSVARGRAHPDSDLDIIVIVETASRLKSKIECVTYRDIRVEYNWIGLGDAEGLVANRAPSQKDLREASRINSGVALWDPHHVCQALAAKAHKLLPPREDTEARLSGAVRTFATLSRGHLPDQRSRVEALRCVMDNVAFIMLSLHPVRYQKAKWVIDDLHHIGEAEICDALSRVYGLAGATAERAARSVESVRRLLRAIGDLKSYPPYEEVLRNGFAPDFAEFSYACRGAEDASSLWRAGAHREALYTARFAAKLGATIFDTEPRLGAEIIFPHQLLIDKAPSLWPLYKTASYGGTNERSPDDETLIGCAEALVRCRQRVEGCYAESG